ncbi:Hypothetical Protein FCC1311_090142 [Hondaea fermentalgiana]|uniref:Apple domain-containing protein n=1 Tax=Hondaea fermentalgiana TaxID=2315210 RepID=A0A2R5GR48_9STRA|nr:Hypothetical Protein FCC1311_090142 [Hondaea fermentalgiana]|eukprot:GBG32789.1 Hypothetical Protein FCC1311_090142 [Hondaea fermentalgiana]
MRSLLLAAAVSACAALGPVISPADLSGRSEFVLWDPVRRKCFAFRWKDEENIPEPVMENCQATDSEQVFLYLDVSDTPLIGNYLWDEHAVGTDGIYDGLEGMAPALIADGYAFHRDSEVLTTGNMVVSTGPVSAEAAFRYKQIRAASGPTTADEFKAAFPGEGYLTIVSTWAAATDAPTQFPTASPTDSPTPFPTESPTPEPTGNPAWMPTPYPTSPPVEEEEEEEAGSAVAGLVVIVALTGLGSVGIFRYIHPDAFDAMTPDEKFARIQENMDPPFMVDVDKLTDDEVNSLCLTVADCRLPPLLTIIRKQSDDSLFQPTLDESSNVFKDHYGNMCCEVNKEIPGFEYEMRNSNHKTSKAIYPATRYQYRSSAKFDSIKMYPSTATSAIEAKIFRVNFNISDVPYYIYVDNTCNELQDNYWSNGFYGNFGRVGSGLFHEVMFKGDSDLPSTHGPANQANGPVPHNTNSFTVQFMGNYEPGTTQLQWAAARNFWYIKGSTPRDKMAANHIKTAVEWVLLAPPKGNLPVSILYMMASKMFLDRMNRGNGKYTTDAFDLSLIESHQESFFKYTRAAVEWLIDDSETGKARFVEALLKDGIEECRSALMPAFYEQFASSSSSKRKPPEQGCLTANPTTAIMDCNLWHSRKCKNTIEVMYAARSIIWKNFHRSVVSCYNCPGKIGWWRSGAVGNNYETINDMRLFPQCLPFEDESGLKYDLGFDMDDATTIQVDFMQGFTCHHEGCRFTDAALVEGDELAQIADVRPGRACDNAALATSTADSFKECQALCFSHDYLSCTAFGFNQDSGACTLYEGCDRVLAAGATDSDTLVVGKPHITDPLDTWDSPTSYEDVNPGYPTTAPTPFPTDSPTLPPNAPPTMRPTSPTARPTGPTASPTLSPTRPGGTRYPTAAPTGMPSDGPTTRSPTSFPTAAQTEEEEEEEDLEGIPDLCPEVPFQQAASEYPAAAVTGALHVENPAAFDQLSAAEKFAIIQSEIEDPLLVELDSLTDAEVNSLCLTVEDCRVPPMMTVLRELSTGQPHQPYVDTRLVRYTNMTGEFCCDVNEEVDGYSYEMANSNGKTVGNMYPAIAQKYRSGATFRSITYYPSTATTAAEAKLFRVEVQVAGTNCYFFVDNTCNNLQGNHWANGFYGTESRIGSGFYNEVILRATDEALPESRGPVTQTEGPIPVGTKDMTIEFMGNFIPGTTTLQWAAATKFFYFKEGRTRRELAASHLNSAIDWMLLAPPRGNLPVALLHLMASKLYMDKMSGTGLYTSEAFDDSVLETYHGSFYELTRTAMAWLIDDSETGTARIVDAMNADGVDACRAALDPAFYEQFADTRLAQRVAAGDGCLRSNSGSERMDCHTWHSRKCQNMIDIMYEARAMVWQEYHSSMASCSSCPGKVGLWNSNAAQNQYQTINDMQKYPQCLPFMDETGLQYDLGFDMDNGAAFALDYMEGFTCLAEGCRFTDAAYVEEDQLSRIVDIRPGRACTDTSPLATLVASSAAACQASCFSHDYVTCTTYSFDEDSGDCKLYAGCGRAALEGAGSAETLYIGKPHLTDLAATWDDPAVYEDVDPQTGSPTSYPTNRPTMQPTSYPTMRPTEPTSRPTEHPTPQPTDAPTTPQPTDAPTPLPTWAPTERGETRSPTTAAPTDAPTDAPTKQPTAKPTKQPTNQQTGQPTAQPTAQPTEEENASTFLSEHSEMITIAGAGLGGLVALCALCGICICRCRSSRDDEETHRLTQALALLATLAWQAAGECHTAPLFDVLKISKSASNLTDFNIQAELCTERPFQNTSAYPEAAIMGAPHISDPAAFDLLSVDEKFAYIDQQISTPFLVDVDKLTDEEVNSMCLTVSDCRYPPMLTVIRKASDDSLYQPTVSTGAVQYSDLTGAFCCDTNEKLEQFDYTVRNSNHKTSANIFPAVQDRYRIGATFQSIKMYPSTAATAAEAKIFRINFTIGGVAYYIYVDNTCNELQDNYWANGFYGSDARAGSGLFHEVIFKGNDDSLPNTHGPANQANGPIPHKTNGFTVQFIGNFAEGTNTFEWAAAKNFWYIRSGLSRTVMAANHVKSAMEWVLLAPPKGNLPVTILYLMASYMNLAKMNNGNGNFKTSAIDLSEIEDHQQSFFKYTRAAVEWLIDDSETESGYPRYIDAMFKDGIDECRGAMMADFYTQFAHTQVSKRKPPEQGCLTADPASAIMDCNYWHSRKCQHTIAIMYEARAMIWQNFHRSLVSCYNCPGKIGWWRSGAVQNEYATINKMRLFPQCLPYMDEDGMKYDLGFDMDDGTDYQLDYMEGFTCHVDGCRFSDAAYVEGDELAQIVVIRPNRTCTDTTPLNTVNRNSAAECQATCFSENYLTCTTFSFDEDTGACKLFAGCGRVAREGAGAAETLYLGKPHLTDMDAKWGHLPVYEDVDPRTGAPVQAPTESPTLQPTEYPTMRPTTPTLPPTNPPTEPGATPFPTAAPTQQPTGRPTTKSPTAFPTEAAPTNSAEEATTDTLSALLADANVIIPVAGGVGVLLVASAALVACLLVVFIYAPASVIDLNRENYHPALEELLDNHTAARSDVLFVDALDAELADAVRGAGLRLGTHHSFSAEGPQGFLGGGLYGFAYKVPVTRSVVTGLATTQILGIREQIRLGARHLDVRVNSDGGVDHGVIFGTLGDFVEALLDELEQTAYVTEDDPVVLYLSPSTYTEETVTVDELQDAALAAGAPEESPLLQIEYLSSSTALLHAYEFSSDPDAINAVVNKTLLHTGETPRRIGAFASYSTSDVASLLAIRFAVLLLALTVTPGICACFFLYKSKGTKVEPAKPQK